jgi:hypothetical protein
MLHFSFEPNLVKLMRGRGLDGSVLQGPTKLKFNFEESIDPFKPKIHEDLKTKTLSADKQIKKAAALLDHPYRGSPVIAVGSYPTDLRAKVFAANVMESAFEEYVDRQNNRRRALMPYWARLYGDTGYGHISAIKEKKPGLLIISNVTENSSNQRLEKLRDILEYFDKIPRIVVLGGMLDPVSFFGTRLFFPVDGAIRIGPDNRATVSPLDI